MGVEKETLVASEGLDQESVAVGKVQRNDKVTVHYKARYEHQGKVKVYENTRGFLGVLGNKKVVFTVGSKDVIAGLDVGIQKMVLGEKAKLGMTSDVAYAENGYKGKVPPNAFILMEVELLSIERNGRVHNQMSGSSCFA